MNTKPSRMRMVSRAMFGAMGWVGGMAVGLLLYFTWKPDEYLLFELPLIGMTLALSYGESRGRIPTVEEERRPITLFPKDPPPERQ